MATLSSGTKSSALTIEDLRIELDLLKAQADALIGADDVAYIARLDRVALLSEVIGRSLIHFALEPVGYLAGIIALANYFSMKNFIGHSVAHKCYHGIEGGESFRIDAVSTRSSPISSEVWAKGHNLHHAHTDNLHSDPDLTQNPSIFRLANGVPWRPAHLTQPAVLAVAVLAAMWFQALYYNGLIDGFKKRELRAFLKDVTPQSYLRQLAKFVTDAANHVGVDYVLFPALAGPLWWKVLAGNLVAEALANVWTALVTLGTHYGAGDDVEFSPDRPKNKAEWYLSQIEGTTDIRLPRFLTHQTVALNLHIAHHLFPNLPPNRLIPLTPKLKILCEKFGLKFREQTVGETSKNVIKRVVKYALPKSLQSWL